jgi:DNA polymerase type B, organellar and viral
MDIETRIIDDGNLEATTISIYDGVKAGSYFLSDYSNPDEMIQAAIKSLMIRKYHRSRVYIHNFSQFDSVFILRNLVYLSNNVRPLIKDGRFINVKFTYAKYYLYFIYSYLIVPASLRSLSSTFNIRN